jgi:Gpi18-like mannosyltransferase
MRSIPLPLSQHKRLLVAGQWVWAHVAREPWILGGWAVQRPLFLALTWLVQFLGVANYESRPITPDTIVYPWISWDGGVYRYIAAHGYDQLAGAAYSPLYPALMWLVRFLPQSGLWISSLAELAALYLLFDLLKRRYSVEIARRAVLFLAWTPFAVIFSATYTESLFLLLSVGVFWAVQRDRLLLAGICAALAALTRQYGILLCLPLLGAWSWKRLVALAMPVLSITTYWVVLSLTLNTPFAPISSVQGRYIRYIAWPWVGIINTLALNDSPHSLLPPAAYRG